MAELIIVFREVLEATLIVGILYTYLIKVGNHSAIIRLWQGVLVALAASLVGSLLFYELAGGFTGRSAKIFEGIVMILAAGILGSMILWMAKSGILDPGKGGIFKTSFFCWFLKNGTRTFF